MLRFRAKHFAQDFFRALNFARYFAEGPQARARCLLPDFVCGRAQSMDWDQVV